MAYFPSVLKQVIDRSFGGKLAALSAAAEMHNTDIGRLIREEVPLTAAKLEKLLSAEGMTEADRALLVHAAVRDFVGEAEYTARFAVPPSPTTELVLREQLRGPHFHSTFPISPRAEQVLRYLINKAGSDADVTTALELLGKFLELPGATELPGASKLTDEHPTGYKPGAKNAELSEPGGPVESESTERVAPPGFAPVTGSGTGRK